MAMCAFVSCANPSATCASMTVTSDGLWNSQARAAEVAQMRQDHCDCTHICFIDDSATYSPKVALLQSPLAYARRSPLRSISVPLEEG